MPVLALELALLLRADGEHGGFTQTGLHYTAQRTLAGLRQSDLNSLSMLSTISFLTPATSFYMKTTLELLKGGRLAGTATKPLTPFSNISTLSLNPLVTETTQQSKLMPQVIH